MAKNRLTEVREEHIPASVKTMYMGHNNINSMSSKLVGDWLHSSFDLISNRVQPESRNVMLHPNPIEKQLEEGVFDIYGSFCNKQPVYRLPDLSRMVTVREVFLQHQDISLIDISHFPPLVENINLNHNAIKDLPNMKHMNSLRKIFLCSNQLKSMPEFPENTEQIDLANNNISDVKHFPIYLKEINLNDNVIEDMPDIRHLKCLRKISVSGNQLYSMPEFPENTERIDLNNNTLQSVKDLSNLKKLTSLNVAKNNIVLVFGLSASLQSLNLKGNPIRTLHKACFQSEEVYQLLAEALTSDQIDALQQPPPQIFRRGYEAVIQYYDEANISKLTDNYRNRVAIIGEASAGKTSLIQTLMNGLPCLTAEDERTQVVDTYTWRLSDNCTYQVFDQGGHDIYTATNRLFISKESKNLICFNLKYGSVEIAEEMLKTTLQQFPNSEIHFVVTQVDLIDNQDILNEKMKTFKHKMLSTLEQQISMLKSKRMSGNTSLIKSYENRKTYMHFFSASSQLFQGISEIVSFLDQLAKQNKQTVPQHWLKCYNLLSKDNEDFLTFDNVHKVYKKSPGLTSKLPKWISRANSKEHLTLCLRYYSDCGLVIWFENNSLLRNFVFHKLQYLINVMKSVLHHDLEGHLRYDTNLSLQKEFYREEFKIMMEKYQDQGLLSFKLLIYLWQEYKLDKEKEEALLMLLQNLDLCHEVINPEIRNDRLMFCPWFVSAKEHPEVINGNSGENIITLHLVCIFNQAGPVNITELMIVRLQRVAYKKHYLGTRQAWKHGLYVSDGTMQEFVIRSEEERSIHIYVKGQPEDIFRIWDDFQTLNEALQEILSHWHGILESVYIPCFHCEFKENLYPHRWSPEEVFSTKRQKVYTSCSRENEVPAILVTKINTDGHKATEKEHINAVKSYIYVEHKGPVNERFNTMTEDEDDLIPPQDDFQGLHATKANYKLTPKDSQFVLDEILPSVCRINIPGFSGTGFIIGGLRDTGTGLTHRYVLTCYHIKLFAALRDQQHCEAQFEARNAANNPIIVVKILQAPLYWSQELDFVLVKLEASQALDNHLAGKVSLGQLVTVNIPAHNDALVLCSHTAEQQIDWGARGLSIDDKSVKMKHGDLKDINVQRQRTYRDPHIYPLSRKFILYQCSCQAGTSGAPCLSASQTRLFAMHCGSVYKGKLERSPEYGLLLKYVVHDIQKKISKPSSVAGSSYMQQGGLQLSDLYSLFPNVPPDLNPANYQVSAMQLGGR